MTQRYNCIGRDWDMEPDDQGDWVRYSDLAKARAEIERLTVERDHFQSEVKLRNRIPSMNDHVAGMQAEIERLTKERDAQYDENVHRIAMQAKAETERDEARSMLADAERDMRQRAADLCDCACMDGIGDKIRAIGDDILALPLKHADREGGV